MLLITYSSDNETNPGPKKNTKIYFCHWNLNRITAYNFSKVSLLWTLATTHEHDITCLSKTFYEYSVNSLDDQSYMADYNFLRVDHPNDRKRGGVCMYFKGHIPILRRDDLCNLPECYGKKKCFFMWFTDLQVRVLTNLMHSVVISICFNLILMI